MIELFQTTAVDDDDDICKRGQYYKYMFFKRRNVVASLVVLCRQKRDKEERFVSHKGLLAENYFNYATSEKEGRRTIDINSCGIL